ncbi:MAG TPA: hypothetical protein VK283_02520 [Acidimicrobiales bacterium]|nr:hypothetical protein [Acidimicrobiales bacterium]
MKRLHDQLPPVALSALESLADRGGGLNLRDDFKRLMATGESHHIAILNLVGHRNSLRS